MATLVLGALLLTPLAGCSRKHASVSENQCLAGDWETLGYRDGVNGQRSTRLLAHQDACVAVGRIPDRETYLAGWRDGIADYCRAENGFAEGERGASYRSVCPESLEPDFLAAWREGRRLYQARGEVTRLETAIAKRERRLVGLEKELVDTGTAQLDPLLTPAQRIELVAQGKRLVDARVRIEHELPALHAELAQRRGELDRLEPAPASLRD